MLRSSKFDHVITDTLLSQERCGGGGRYCGLTVARRQAKTRVVRAAGERASIGERARGASEGGERGGSGERARKRERVNVLGVE